MLLSLEELSSSSEDDLLPSPDLVGGKALGLLRLRRSLLVGLAVVTGMLVSRVAQFLLALAGVAGFVLLSRLLLPG